MSKRKRPVEVNKYKLYRSSITGRYRKLSDGAMIAIREAYGKGASIRELKEMYGVSDSVIRSICYWTRHGE